MKQKLVMLDFTERDLDFLIAAVVSDSYDTATVRDAIRHDPAYRKAIVSDERVFSQVANDDGSFLKISPALYFEVLLRRAQRDLESTSYTIERSGKESIPVFDSVEVADFLDSPYVLEYLAHMLASFTRIQSYVIPVRIRKGIHRRIRYNDMDIDSLIQFASKAEEPERFSFYKRIGDVCLFVTGLFRDHRYSEVGKTSVVRDSVYRVRQSSSPAWPRRIKRSVEEYEAEGKRFYKLAELHPTASTLELADVFNVLREQFTAARKPLAFLSTHYLHSRQNNLFGITS